jgi:hypothetical protein
MAKKLLISLPNLTAEWLRQMKAETGINLSSIVEKALEDYWVVPGVESLKQYRQRHTKRERPNQL